MDGTNILSTISQGLNQTLFPGHRVIRVNGWESAEKYPMPRDCETIMLDGDPNSDYIYMKVTDSNGRGTIRQIQTGRRSYPAVRTGQVCYN